MAAEDVVAILDQLDAVGLTVWLDGGWGVDALLGRQTRAHDDLDLVVAIGDVPALEDELAVLGYKRAGGVPPKSFDSVDAHGRQVDSHPVAFDERGDGVYLMEDGRTWSYPAVGFGGAGVVAGRRVRCLTPEVQVLCHAGYELEADDLQDLRELAAQFGTDPPDRRE